MGEKDDEKLDHFDGGGGRTIFSILWNDFLDAVERREHSWEKILGVLKGLGFLVTAVLLFLFFRNFWGTTFLLGDFFSAFDFLVTQIIIAIIIASILWFKRKWLFSLFGKVKIGEKDMIQNIPKRAFLNHIWNEKSFKQKDATRLWKTSGEDHSKLGNKLVEIGLFIKDKKTHAFLLKTDDRGVSKFTYETLAHALGDAKTAEEIQNTFAPKEDMVIEEAAAIENGKIFHVQEFTGRYPWSVVPAHPRWEVQYDTLPDGRPTIPLKWTIHQKR